VTGVQTCALPISVVIRHGEASVSAARSRVGACAAAARALLPLLALAGSLGAFSSSRKRSVPRGRESALEQGEAQDGVQAELLALAHRSANGVADHTAGTWRRSDARPQRRAWHLRRALLVADLAGCAAALLFVQFFIVHYRPRDFTIDGLMAAGLLGWVVLAQLLGLYEERSAFATRSGAEDLPTIFVLATLATWLGLLLLDVMDMAHPRLSNATTFWFGAIVFVVAARAIARALVPRLSPAQEPTLILGSGRIARHIARKLRSRPTHGLDVVGFVDDDPAPLEDNDIPYLGDTTRLELVIRAYRIEHVILAFSRMPVDAQVELSRRCMDLGIQVDIVPRMFEVIGSGNRVHDLDGLPLVEIRPARLARSSRLLKRCLDLVVGGFLLPLAAPFMIFAALRIKLESPGPVFFRQERMGAGGRRFVILKFRTMYEDAEERKGEVEHLNRHRENGPKMFKVTDDPRITPFGNFLRRWSLDELPQLFNVMRGEMSLVGPRPLILDEDTNVLGFQRRRLHLLPGITGLWQVLGRSDIPFSEMVTLDHLYVTNWSLWGDVKLLLRTVPAVLGRRGAY